MNEWQHLETVPKDGTQFLGLLFFKDTGFEIDIVRWKKTQWFEGWDCELFNIEEHELKAWCPLPEIPQTPSEKHECSKDGMECFTAKDGKLLLRIFSYDYQGNDQFISFSVGYCPICGIKAGEEK